MRKIKKYIKKYKKIYRPLEKYEKWGSLIVWMSLIYYFSAQPSFVTGFDMWTFISRKLGHILEYGVVTLLVFRILSRFIFLILRNHLTIFAPAGPTETKKTAGRENDAY